MCRSSRRSSICSRLKKQFGLSYIFISHDLAVVEHVSDRLAVMYLGRIVETAATEDLFARPSHPYTEALISAVPCPDPQRRGQRVVLKGEMPNPERPPPGCPSTRAVPRRWTSAAPRRRPRSTSAAPAGPIWCAVICIETKVGCHVPECWHSCPACRWQRPRGEAATESDSEVRRDPQGRSAAPGGHHVADLQSEAKFNPMIAEHVAIALHRRGAAAA